MSKKILKSIAILGLIFNTLPLNATDNSNGLYIGLDAAFINIGDDTLEVGTYDSDGNNKNTKKYKDATSLSYDFKIGYQHYDKNRIEFTIKDKKIKTDTGDITANTLGINYELGFSSLESKNVLPYVSVGLDVGRAELKNFEFSNKKVDTISAIFGLGIRYNINENVDAKIGYLHSSTGFGDFENEKGDVQGIAQNQLDFGVSYKF